MPLHTRHAVRTHPCSPRDAPYVHPGSCTGGDDSHVHPGTTQAQTPAPRVPPATCATAAAPPPTAPRRRHLHAQPPPQLPPCQATRAQTHQRRTAGGSAPARSPPPLPDAHLEPPAPLRAHGCLPPAWHAPRLHARPAAHAAMRTHLSWHMGGQPPPQLLLPTTMPQHLPYTLRQLHPPHVPMHSLPPPPPTPPCTA